jgi:hypothetical protein
MWQILVPLLTILLVDAFFAQTEPDDASAMLPQCFR